MEKGMKKVKLAEVLSALDAQIAVGAILVNGDIDAQDVAQAHFSEFPGDEVYLNNLKKNKEIVYFFSAEDCPIKEEEVNLLVAERLYVVKLP